MTRLETTCGGCGRRIHLAVPEVRLLATEPDDQHIAFVCPMCGQAATRTADPRLLEILRAVGVEVEEPAAVVASSHPESPDPTAPPLTHDDLLRFHEQLSIVGWLERVVAAGGARPGRGSP
jgi:predicted RNA-binding Zn-ribbon protein involved in translation (DUF1610 family)